MTTPTNYMEMIRQTQERLRLRALERAQAAAAEAERTAASEERSRLLTERQQRRTPEEIALERQQQDEELRQYQAQRELEMRQQRVRVNRMQIHRTTDSIKDKISSILYVIKNDIGIQDYSDIISFLDARIKTYINTNKNFISKKINNTIIQREQWLKDYDTIRNELYSQAKYISIEQKEQLGYIIDFVFKHNLQECFTIGFIYDNAHAYNGDPFYKPISCIPGIIERSITTLINCSRGIRGGPFDELSAIIENNMSSWNQLDRTTRTIWMNQWNDFVPKWINYYKSNPAVKSMTANDRNNALMNAFISYTNAPGYIVDQIKSTQFPEFTDTWWMDFINSKGGRRYKKKTKKTRKKSKKTRRTHYSKIPNNHSRLL